MKKASGTAVMVQPEYHRQLAYSHEEFLAQAVREMDEHPPRLKTRKLANWAAKKAAFLEPTADSGRFLQLAGLPIRIWMRLPLCRPLAPAHRWAR